MVGNSSDDTNFPHKLLLTITHVSKICKNFAKGLATYIIFSETASV